ncbi:drug/metabolite transporter (DMT)-like permease [Pedobacter sp. AK013]|nr:drug/metabolite transporter (DMT)-like permease [Pedobacter sp. AK013]
MNRKIKEQCIWFFYIIGIFFIIPIISYYLSLPDIFPKQAYIQVYLSGPILLILGLFLFFNYRKKTIGLIFLVTGVWWIFNIIYELLTK